MSYVYSEESVEQIRRRHALLELLAHEVNKTRQRGYWQQQENIIRSDKTYWTDCFLRRTRCLWVYR